MEKGLMKVEKLKKNYSPDSLMIVPQRGGESRFAFPAFGPDTYDNDVRAVIANGLVLPTGERTAFMLDATYNVKGTESDSKEAEFVRKNIINDAWLWVPNVNIWTPQSIKNPGVYIVFDEKGLGRNHNYDLNQLEERLSGGETEKGVRFSKDRKVAFAPLTTLKSGYHDKGTLAQDGAYIANFGVEGAEKLDDVAKRFTFKPYSWIVENGSNENVQNLSALSGGWSVGGYGLSAGFGSVGYDRNGFVFGETGSK